MQKNLVGACCILALLAFQSCKTQDKSDSQSFIQVSNFDSTVNPGDNFYDYVNGKWIKTTTIDPTESGAGAFLDIYNKTKENLKLIVEEAAKGNHKEGSIEQKVGDFYISAMDTLTIEKRGYEPLKPYFEKIDAVKSTNDLAQLIANFETENLGVLFGLYVGPDDKNSAVNTIFLSQAGLGLPDRDYYFKTDAASIEAQNAYKKFIATSFKLIGADSNTANNKSANIYALEKALANSHRTNVELRNPEKNYNKIAVKDLAASQPNFQWNNYFKTIGANLDSVVVGQPAYLKTVNDLLVKTPLTTWQDYLKANVIKAYNNALSKPFVENAFNYNKTFSGQQVIKPRWERVMATLDAKLGDAVGELYVKKHFTKEAKTRMDELVTNLQKAFEKRIDALDWMGDSTKIKAKEKLYTFIKKIGYPDKFRDYSKVAIKKDTYFENRIASDKNEFQYNITKAGKPVDKTEWGMTPPTINAYYNPTVNEIVFPAGILQFPFFDINADDAINYGGIGMVIGHEMTHGFDDQGAQYDKEGNLKNWWTAKDNEQFKAKAKQVIDLYNGFIVLDSLHINGELTTGENMADIGGIAIAYDAFKMTKQGKDTTKIDGFTPDQRFFIAYAQGWKNKDKDESLRTQINTDPHSPANYRVNGPLMNFTPFYTAFNVKEGNKMYLPESKRIKIW